MATPAITGRNDEMLHVIIAAELRRLTGFTDIGVSMRRDSAMGLIKVLATIGGKEFGPYMFDDHVLCNPVSEANAIARKISGEYINGAGKAIAAPPRASDESRPVMLGDVMGHLPSGTKWHVTQIIERTTPQGPSMQLVMEQVGATA